MDNTPRSSDNPLEECADLGPEVSAFLAKVKECMPTLADVRSQAEDLGGMVQSGDVLLEGNYLLLVPPDGPAILALSAEDGTCRTFTSSLLGPDEGFAGFDVDASGERVLVVKQFDDFPEVLVLDAEGRSQCELNCDELIDLHITDVKWKDGTSGFTYFDWGSMERLSIKIDYSAGTVMPE